MHLHTYFECLINLTSILQLLEEAPPATLLKIKNLENPHKRRDNMQTPKTRTNRDSHPEGLTVRQIWQLQDYAAYKCFILLKWGHCNVAFFCVVSIPAQWLLSIGVRMWCRCDLCNRLVTNCEPTEPGFGHSSMEGCQHWQFLATSCNATLRVGWHVLHTKNVFVSIYSSTWF